MSCRYYGRGANVDDTANRGPAILGRARCNPSSPLSITLCSAIARDSDLSWLCKAIGRITITSGLLQSAKFQFLALPDKFELRGGPIEGTDKPPTHPSDVNPEPDDVHSSDAPDHVAQPSLSLTQLEDFVICTSEQYQSVNGLSIDILRENQVIGKATIGGVVNIEGCIFGMTVRHVFRQHDDEDLASEFPSSGDGEEWEIDLFEDECFEAPNSSIHPLEALVEPEALAGGPNFAPESDHPAPTSTQSFPPTLTQGDTHHRVLAGARAQLDWALMDLGHHPGENEHFEKPESDMLSSLFVMKSPPRLRLGALLKSTGILGVPTMPHPQPVMVAALRDVHPGECGSWAMRWQDRTYVGMLVGSCESLGEAHLIRLADILEDIRLQTGSEARLDIPAWQTQANSSGNHPGYLPPQRNCDLADQDLVRMCFPRVLTGSPPSTSPRSEATQLYDATSIGPRISELSNIVSIGSQVLPLQSNFVEADELDMEAWISSWGESSLSDPEFVSDSWDEPASESITIFPDDFMFIHDGNSAFFYPVESSELDNWPGDEEAGPELDSEDRM